MRTCVGLLLHDDDFEVLSKNSTIRKKLLLLDDAEMLMPCKRPFRKDVNKNTKEEYYLCQIVGRRGTRIKYCKRNRKRIDEGETLMTVGSLLLYMLRYKNDAKKMMSG